MERKIQEGDYVPDGAGGLTSLGDGALYRRRGGSSSPGDSSGNGMYDGGADPL